MRKVTRAAAVDEDTAAARDEENAGSVMEDVVHPGQAVLGGQFLALHLRHRGWRKWQSPDKCIGHLFIQLLVALIKPPELAVALQQGIDLTLWLRFKPVCEPPAVNGPS